jgi:hypothetical protein
VTETEKPQQAAGVTVADIGRQLDQLLRAFGIVPQAERPYLGSRYGWYPRRPKGWHS